VRIQNLSFASYLYITSSLLFINLNSSAFAFQAPTVESNSTSNPAPASNDLLKSPQKNNVSAPVNLIQTNWSQLSPEQKNSACATRGRVEWGGSTASEKMVRGSR
jgi:hypothetical protein